MEPVHNEPALRFEKDGETYLVVADLHIGIEHEIDGKGLSAPTQTRRLAGLLVSIGEAIGATRLVIVGDAKHNLPRSSAQERFEVPRFFETLEMQFEKVDLVRGNHDGGIDYLAPREVAIHASSGFTIGRYGFCHGHSWPSEKVAESDVLVLGHSHPTALFKDRLGRRATERCWLRGKWAKCDRYPKAKGSFILLPAVHPYCGGTPVNEEGRGILGPLFRNGCLDYERAEIFLLDGTNLGKRKANMV